MNQEEVEERPKLMSEDAVLAMLKILSLSILFAAVLSMAMGLIENTPQVSAPDTVYYGYPLVWRIPSINSTEIRYTSLAIDIAFWFIVISAVFIIIRGKLSPK